MNVDRSRVPDLIGRFRDQGIPASTDDAIRVAALLERVQFPSEEDLAGAVASIVARNPEEYAAVEAITRAWLRPAKKVAKAQAVAKIADRRVARFVQRWWPAAVVAGFVAVAAVAVAVPVGFVLLMRNDADRDGYTRAIDCDDTNSSIHPLAMEVCDGVDQDCTGHADDVTGDVLPRVDADGDGWFVAEGEPQHVALCDAEKVNALPLGDCDDADPTMHIDAPDELGDDVDQNCDGLDGTRTDSGECYDPDLKDYASRRTGLFAFLVGAPVAGVLAAGSFFAGIRRAGRQARQYWRGVLDALPGPRWYRWSIPAFPRALPAAVARETAWALLGRTRAGHPTLHLDVKRTVAATLREGRPRIVWKTQRRSPGLVVLEDQGFHMAPWRRLVEDFVDHLGRAGLPVERFAFQGAADRVSGPHGAMDLGAMLRRAHGRPVVVISSGSAALAPDAGWVRRIARDGEAQWWCPITDPDWWHPALRDRAFPMAVWPMDRRGLLGSVGHLGGLGGAPVHASRGRSARQQDLHRVAWLAGLIPDGSVRAAAALYRHLVPSAPNELVLAIEGLVPDRTHPEWEAQRREASEWLSRVGDPFVEREAECRAIVLAEIQRAEPLADSAAHLRWRRDAALVQMGLPEGRTEALEGLERLANGPLHGEVRTGAAPRPPGSLGLPFGWPRPLWLVGAVVAGAMAAAAAVWGGVLEPIHPATQPAYSVFPGPANSVRIVKFDWAPPIVDVRRNDEFVQQVVLEKPVTEVAGFYPGDCVSVVAEITPTLIATSGVLRLPPDHQSAGYLVVTVRETGSGTPLPDATVVLASPDGSWARAIRPEGRPVPTGRAVLVVTHATHLPVVRDIDVAAGTQSIEQDMDPAPEPNGWLDLDFVRGETPLPGTHFAVRRQAVGQSSDPGPIAGFSGRPVALPPGTWVVERPVEANGPMFEVVSARTTSGVVDLERPGQLPAPDPVPVNLPPRQGRLRLEFVATTDEGRVKVAQSPQVVLLGPDGRETLDAGTKDAKLGVGEWRIETVPGRWLGASATATIRADQETVVTVTLKPNPDWVRARYREIEAAMNDHTTFTFEGGLAPRDQEALRELAKELLSLGYDGKVMLQADIGAFLVFDGNDQKVRLCTNDDYRDQCVTIAKDAAKEEGTRRNEVVVDLLQPLDVVSAMSYGLERSTMDDGRRSIEEQNAVALRENRVVIRLARESAQ